jgi:hypothetical protein
VQTGSSALPCAIGDPRLKHNYVVSYEALPFRIERCEMENPNLKTEPEVAPLLRVMLKTLQTWRALRKGPRFVRIGRRVFYPTADLERFLVENTVETGASALSARDANDPC